MEIVTGHAAAQLVIEAYLGLAGRHKVVGESAVGDPLLVASDDEVLPVGRPLCGRSVKSRVRQTSSKHIRLLRP